jgi:ABC-type transport system involved in multi-copper enzyme maturation permease subunit
VTALLAVEWRRIVARRLVRVLAVLSSLAIASSAVIVFLTSHRLDASGVDKSFNYEAIPEVLMGVSPFTIILGWLIGASAIGAEWHAGTVTTLLTWEPRRVRVLLAKVAAALVLTFLLSAALLLLTAVVLAPAGLFRGTMTGVDAAWARWLAGVVARAAAVSGLSAVFGFTLAAIGRNTAAALGIGFLYLAVIEGIIRGVKPGWVRWLVGDNTAVVITNRPAEVNIGRSTLEAAVLLSAYAAILVAAAVATFRQRDIT